MTKDQMRALLADLVPAAEAAGAVVHFQPFSHVKVRPNTETVVETRTVRPMRMHRRQGRMGAGFEIETHKNWSDR